MSEVKVPDIVSTSSKERKRLNEPVQEEKVKCLITKNAKLEDRIQVLERHYHSLLKVQLHKHLKSLEQQKEATDRSLIISQGETNMLDGILKDLLAGLSYEEYGMI
jgi:glutamyl-tRNA reductase